MKRRLSLLLAVVMILGSFSFAFAAEETAEEKAGAFLMKVGVLEGINGELKLEDNLRRQDAVVLVARLHGAEDEAKKFPTDDLKFTDFKDPFYRPIIAWAVANDLVEGHTPERFGFNEDVTAQQYATILLRALGYNDDVAGKDGYAKALELAKKLGVLENVEVENDTAITRGQMAVMTFNALGTKMKDSDKTLADKLGIKMPEEPKPEKLEVVDVYTENLAEVVVELSNAELVKNKDALLNPANYRLGDGIKVYNVDLDGDNVILTLVPYGRLDEVKEKATPLTKGRKYSLTIRNIDPAINKTYRNVEAIDNAVPAVEKVEFMGTHGIKVVTTEPIANPLERNFRINDKRTSMIVEQYGREIILTPYHGRAFDEDATELVVEGLEDFAGYKSVKDVYEMEISEDDALPVVEEAYRSGSKLVLVFDRDVYHDSISPYVNRRVLGNVSFVEKRATFYAEDAYKVDTNVVEYIFGREIPKGIEVEIEGVANHFNKAMEKQSIVPVEFKDEYAPVIINFTDKVVVTKAFENAERGTEVDTKNMTITFDKDIAEFVPGKDETKADVVEYLNDNIDRYFTLYELDITRRGELAAKEIDITVEDAVDDTIKLSFKDIKLNNKDRDYDYILEVRNFHDLSGNRMERDYLDFQVVLPSAAFKVELKEINNTRYFNRAGVEIVLEFNDYVDKEEASIAKNYYLVSEEDNVVDLAVSEAIVERDGYTVSLVVYDTTVTKLLEKYAELEISPRVTNADGDPLSQKNRFVKLISNEAREAAALAEAIDAANTELDKVADALAAYTAAGGNATDDVYKAVTNAETALNTALSADPQVRADIEEATTDLANALKTLDEATADLLAAAKSLSDAKVLAKHELNNYVDAAGYTKNPAALTAAITAGETAIDAATTTEEVDTALANAKSVIDDIESDTDLVEKAKENLDLGDLSAVTDNLTLPSTQDEATITWESSNPGVIANDGTVTRPAAGEENVVVTLTATIKVGAAEDTKVFTVTVLAEDE